MLYRKWCAASVSMVSALHHNHCCLTALEIYEIVINYTMNKHCNQDKRKLLSDQSRIFLIFLRIYSFKCTYILGPENSRRHKYLNQTHAHCSATSRFEPKQFFLFVRSFLPCKQFHANLVVGEYSTPNLTYFL